MKVVIQEGLSRTISYNQLFRQLEVNLIATQLFIQIISHDNKSSYLSKLIAYI